MTNSRTILQRFCKQHAPTVVHPFGTWQWFEEVETMHQVEALMEVAEADNPTLLPVDAIVVTSKGSVPTVRRRR